MALLWSAGRLALNFLSVEISSGAVPFSIYNTLLKHSFFFLFLSFFPHREISKNKKKKTHSLPVSFAYAIGFLPLQTSLENFHHPNSDIQKK